jgi:hypothetical protein
MLRPASLAELGRAASASEGSHDAR